MKLVTYDAGTGMRIGMLEDEQVVELEFNGDMISFIEARPSPRRGKIVAHPRLLAPLRPRSLRDFMTFQQHFNDTFERLGVETSDEWFSFPAYYKGMPDTVIGPGEEIPWPAYSSQIDHELELAAVIGRKGRDIPPEDALSYVFGYTIWNDVSARDVQPREMHIGMGPGKTKDWDGSNVLGPCLVTADELDPRDLRMKARINGETWGEDTSANMHYSFADLIAHASQAQTLYPGDVFGSGTAAGGSGIEVGRWLREGDLVELEIEGIGVLQNRIGVRQRR